MKQYIEQESGSYQLDNLSIPNSEGNRHYAEMFEQLSSGEASLVAYLKPLTDLEDEVRAKRDQRLIKEIDIYSGIRWAACTTYQKGLLNDLRDMLLNIPEQAGFPHDVEWPALVNI